MIGLETPTYGGKTRLARLNRTTLHPLLGGATTIPDSPTQFVVSPDGNTLAIGGQNGGVYLASLTRLGRAHAVHTAFPGQLPGNPTAYPISWPIPRRLLVATQVEQAHVSTRATLLWVDPQTHRITRRWPLHRSLIDTATTTNGTTLLLVGPTDLTTIGHTELIEITPSGQLHTRALPEVSAGYDDPGTVGSAAVTPGLAVGHGQFYIAFDSELLSGSLRSLRLAVHHVPKLLAAHFLASTSAVTGSAGALAQHERTVTALPSHRILVTGEDSRAVDHGRRLRSVEEKTTIVDIRTWKVACTLPLLSGPVAVHPTIIGSFADRHGRQIGVAGYRPDGKLEFARRLGRTQDFWWTNDRLTRYSTTGSPRPVVLNPTSGRDTRLVRPLAADYPFPIFTWTPGHRRTAAPIDATAAYSF